MIPTKNVIHFLLRTIVFVLISQTIFAQTGAVTHVHDPCIIKSEGSYYIFSTGDRIEMRRSDDLNYWQRLNQVFPSIPEWGVQEVPGVRNIWAPDIFYRDSVFYLYYSLSTFGSNHSRIGLATNKTLNTSSPDYKWIDQGKVIESNSINNYNAIDPNIVEDKEGRLWLSFGSFWSGIKLVELDTTTMKPSSNSTIHSIARRSGVGAVEAPFIILKDNYYYLFVSFDFCCQGINSTYNTRVGRAENITGPYKDRYDVLMTSGGSSTVIQSNERWRGQGHCAVLIDEGNYWLVHHAYDAEANGIPTLRIEKLIWDDDNWPIIDDMTNGVNGQSKIPDTFELYQNYPNPFNPTTIIKYAIPKNDNVKISVYDLLGSEIKLLIDEYHQKGFYEVEFNAEDISNGIYFYRLQSGNFSETKKLTLLK